MLSSFLKFHQPSDHTRFICIGRFSILFHSNLYGFSVIIQLKIEKKLVSSEATSPILLLNKTGFNIFKMVANFYKFSWFTYSLAWIKINFTTSVEYYVNASKLTLIKSIKTTWSEIIDWRDICWSKIINLLNYGK